MRMGLIRGLILLFFRGWSWVPWLVAVTSTVLLVGSCDKPTERTVRFYKRGQDSQIPYRNGTREGPDSDRGSAYYHFIDALELEFKLLHKQEQLRLVLDSKTTQGALDTVLGIEGLASGEEASVDSEKDDRGKTNDGTEKSIYGIGLVQSDILYHFSSGNHPQLLVSRATSNVRAVARAFEEWLILSWEHPNADWDHVLTAESICMDKVGSGSMFTGLNLVQVLQPRWRSQLHGCAEASLRPPLLLERPLQLRVLAPKAVQEWRNVLGVPERIAEDLSGIFKRSYRLVKPTEFCDGLALPDSAWSKGMTKGECLERRLATVAVDATLVVSRDLPDDIAQALECIIDRWDRSLCGSYTTAKGSPRCDQLYNDGRPWYDKSLYREEGELSDVEAALDLTGYCDVVDPLSSGPKKELVKVKRENHPRYDNLAIRPHNELSVRRLDPISRAVLHVNGAWMLALLAFSTLIFLYREYLRHGRLSRSVVLFELLGLARLLWPVLLGLLLGTVFFTCAIWVAEFHSTDMRVNEEFIDDGVEGAMGWAFRFIFTNSSDVELKSAGGLVYFGIMKLLWAAGSLTPTGLALRAVWRRYAAVARHKDHVIIIGWNNQTSQLIEQLLEDEIGVVVIPFVPPPPTFDHQAKVLEHRNGLGKDALREAGFGSAAVVVICTDDRYARERGVSPDMHTLQMIQSYRESEAELGTRRTPARMVVEIVHSDHRELANAIGLGQRYGLATGDHEAAFTYSEDLFQVVCPSEIANTVLAEILLKPDVEQLFEELLENNAGNEFYDVQVQELRTYFPFHCYNDIRRALARAIGEYAAVPLAINFGPSNPRSTSQRSVLNPSHRLGEEPLLDDDAVVFIADRKNTILLALEERSSGQSHPSHEVRNG